MSSIKTSIVLSLPLCKEPNSTSTKTSSESHMRLKLQFSSAHLSQLIYDLWKLCDWLFACEQWALIDGPIIYHAAIDLGIVDRFGTLGIAGLHNAFYFERSLKWRSEIEFWWFCCCVTWTLRTPTVELLCLTHALALPYEPDGLDSLDIIYLFYACSTHIQAFTIIDSLVRFPEVGVKLSLKTSGGVGLNLY